MTKDNLAVAVAYYTAIGEKNVNEAAKYWDSSIHLISPLAEIAGKDKMLIGITNFTNSFQAITIREKFSNGDNVMLVIDVDFPVPMALGRLYTAALLTVRDGLITRIELFHDTKLFEKHQ